MAFRRSLSYSKFANISQQIFGNTIFKMVDMEVGFVMSRIDHCLAYGLRKPEFYQDDDFRIVIWKRGEVRGNVGVQENTCQLHRIQPSQQRCTIETIGMIVSLQPFLQHFLFHSPI